MVLGASTVVPAIGDAMFPAVSNASRSHVSAAQLQADVAQYVSFGVHQSGSVGDNATVGWMTRRLRASGYKTQLQPVDVPFFDERSVDVTLQNGTVIQAIGQHPVVTTDAQGLSASLVLWDDDCKDQDLDGKIAIIVLPFGRHSSSAHPAVSMPLRAVLDRKAVGVILVAVGPSGQALALNAPDEQLPQAVPILVIGSKDRGALLKAACTGERATLRMVGSFGRRTAHNVAGRRIGTGKKVVLTTPLSGWFTCGAERGSGVAAFLALSDWLAHNFPDLDITLGAMTGHEFEYIGSKKFNQSAELHPSMIALWVHLGAAFASRDWHEFGVPGDGILSPLPNGDSNRFLLAHSSFLPFLRRSMQGVAGFEAPYPASVENAAGEAKQILIDGHSNLIANFGAHRLHHARIDDAKTTSGELILQAYLGLTGAINEILKSR
jgi:hypothetical protein